MTILYPASQPVKPSTFGRGIVPTRRPARRFEPSAADQRFAAETSPYRDMGYDVSGPSDDGIEEAARMAAERAQFDAALYF